jgi:hypothetical protein
MEASRCEALDFAAIQRRKTTDYLAVIAEAAHAPPQGVLFFEVWIDLIQSTVSLCAHGGGPQTFGRWLW